MPMKISRLPGRYSCLFASAEKIILTCWIDLAESTQSNSNPIPGGGKTRPTKLAVFYFAAVFNLEYVFDKSSTLSPMAFFHIQAPPSHHIANVISTTARRQILRLVRKTRIRSRCHEGRHHVRRRWGSELRSNGWVWGGHRDLSRGAVFGSLLAWLCEMISCKYRD